MRALKALRSPICHPERVHEALGLCYACYKAQWRRNRPKNTLPRRRYNQMPMSAYDPMRWIPEKTVGVRQNAVTIFPMLMCIKCGKQNTLMYEGREAHCAGVRGGCGATYYLTKEVAT